MEKTISFSPIINGFSKNLEMIRDFVNLVEPILAKEGNKQIKKDAKNLWPILLAAEQAGFEGLEKIGFSKKTREDLQKKNGLKVTGKKENLKFEIDKKADLRKIKEINDAHHRFFFSLQRSAFLYQTSLISLVSAAEWFLGQTLDLHFKAFPDIITESSTKNFTYKDLKKFATIQDARDSLVEDKINDVIRSGFIDWIKFLKDKASLNTKRIEKYIDETHEFFLRRNLLVHNQGIINTTYLNNLPKSISNKDEYKLNDKLTVDREYLIRAITVFEIIFIDISSQVWSKQIKSEEQEEDYFSTLNGDIAYPHIQEERYEIAEHICGFLSKNEKLSEKSRLYATINYWQSVKWQDRYEEIKKEIEETDFSAKGKLFLLVKLALLEKNKDFFSLLPEVLEPKGELPIEAFKEYPVFKVQRKSKRTWGKIIKDIEEQKKKSA